MIDQIMLRKSSNSMTDKCPETLFVPFDAQENEIVNARSLFVDAGFIDGYVESSKMSSILQKVQSKMGTRVQGYDDKDDFIDDSGITGNGDEVQELDINNFKIVLSLKGKSDQQAKSRSEDPGTETEAVTKGMAPFIDRIRRATIGPIEAQLTKIRQKGAKNVQMIPISNEMIEAISNCVEEKVRLETEQLGTTPAKQRIANWRKDALQTIFTKCFTCQGHQFTTMRRLQVALGKSQRKDAPQTKDDAEDIKELPSEV